jgi:glycosyltransferase involved in cell wall biosynthesis
MDYKWLDVLLSSLEYVEKNFPDFTLIIAWPGDTTLYKKELESFKNNIKIYNYNIEPEEAFKFFEISEFIVLPYKDATWSWVIPVSYSFSKPVLATNVWELAWVVEDGKTWYLVEPDNSKILWEKIIEMLREKSKVESMWIAGRKFSDTELSWKDIVDNIYK